MVGGNAECLVVESFLHARRYVMYMSKKAFLIVCCITALIAMSTHAFAGNKLISTQVDAFEYKTVYTVPQGKNLLMKTLVVTNLGSSVASVNLSAVKGEAKTLMILKVGVNESYAHNFQNLVVRSGSDFIVHNTSSTILYVTITGVLK